MNNLVFVYGTLRKNLGWNHLLKNSEFISNAITKDSYAMYANSIPYVKESEKVSSIKGEIYLVNDETLKNLDSLENHPNWYFRKEIEVLTELNETKLAWIYFNEDPKGEKVLSGDYLTFLENKK